MTVQQDAAKPPAAAADERAELFQTYFGHLFDRQFDKALDSANRIDVDADNRPGLALVTVMRASALLGLKRNKEAHKLIAEAERLAPQEPIVSSTLFTGAILAENMEVAGDAIDRLIARAPDAARELDRDFVSYFLRNEPKGQDKRNEDRRIALVRLGYGAETSVGDYFAKDAVEILVKRGHAAEAGELLRYIDEPRILEDLLIQKRYAALWPQIEASAGPHLHLARASSVRSAEQAFQGKPDDHQNLQLLANALRYARRHADAIALRSRLPASSAAMAAADEEMGWAVNNVALALHEAGRADEADQLFALLNEVPMKQGGWRVSMIINRLELLVSSGKFDQALPLLSATETSAAKDGSPYAQQLVRRLKYCTLIRLGLKEEANKLRAELLDHAKDARAPTIDGLLCANEVDTAEKLALAWLKENDDFNEDFVRALQARPLTADDPSVWSSGWRDLRARPAIAAEFERLGRDMPDALLPPPIAK